MGDNSIVIVRHDSLAQIKGDAKFGEKLVAACNSWPTMAGFMRNQQKREPFVDVQAEADGVSSVNAATVIHSSHIDEVQLVIVGGGIGRVLGSMYNRGNYSSKKDQDAVLTRVMNDLGYKLTRRGNVVDRVASIPTDTKDDRIAELEAMLKKAHAEITTLQGQLSRGDAKPA